MSAPQTQEIANTDVPSAPRADSDLDTQKRPCVGIVGGGQLARMLVLAGVPLGIKFKIYDPSPDACAGHVAPMTCGAFADSNALLAFARDVDVLTFDFENVPAATLEALADRITIAPNPRALAMTQDRMSEKTAFGALGIPVADFRAVNSRTELQAAVQELGTNGILKTRTLGYDGKGQVRINADTDLAVAYASLGSSPCVFEQLVQFRRELSQVATRNAKGDFVCYPLAENVHKDGILATSFAPALASAAIVQTAQNHARQVAQHFDYVGTFALEFFDCDGHLVLNEMAPRVHNSGHWSIEGAICSQFENHLRAILNWPLGDPQPIGISLMLNWIGVLPNRRDQLFVPNLHFHDYGKGARAGRKVGHSTIVGTDVAAVASALKKLSSTDHDATTALASHQIAALNAY